MIEGEWFKSRYNTRWHRYDGDRLSHGLHFARCGATVRRSPTLEWQADPASDERCQTCNRLRADGYGYR